MIMTHRLVKRFTSISVYPTDYRHPPAESLKTYLNYLPFKYRKNKEKQSKS